MIGENPVAGGNRPSFPEERDGKAGKAPSLPQEPIEDERSPQFPTEKGGTSEGDEDE